MTDFDVTLEFTIPDVAKDEADEIVEHLMEIAAGITGWAVGARVVVAEHADQGGCVFCIDAGADFDWCRACGRGFPIRSDSKETKTR